MDSAAITDPRMHLLARHLGINVFEVLGRILRVWFVSYDRRSAVLQPIEIDIAADRDGFADAMVASGLAVTEEDGGLYVKGVSERIAFLELQAEKGKRSGQIRRDKSQLRTPAQQGFMFGSNQKGTPVEQRFKSGRTGQRTYSPDLDLDQAPDLAPDHPPRDARGTAPGIPSEQAPRSDSRPVAAPEQAEPLKPRGSGVEPQDEAYTLAHLLLQLVIENNPNGKVAKQTENQRADTAARWAVPIDRLQRLDKMAWGAIEGMIRWCQRDQFWRAVILGGDNLRDKWDTMAAQRNRTGGGRPNAPPQDFNAELDAAAAAITAKQNNAKEHAK